MTDAERDAAIDARMLVLKASPITRDTLCLMVADLEASSLTTAAEELIEEWTSEIADYSTKDDPYYNGVRACLSNLKDALAALPSFSRAVKEPDRKHDFDCPLTQLVGGEDGKVYRWPDECCTCKPSKDWLGYCLCGLKATSTRPVLAEGFALPVCERHALAAEGAISSHRAVKEPDMDAK